MTAINGKMMPPCFTEAVPRRDPDGPNLNLAEDEMMWELDGATPEERRKLIVGWYLQGRLVGDRRLFIAATVNLCDCAHVGACGRCTACGRNEENLR